MTELARKALLPAGLQDVLPGIAAREADIREKLMSSFAHAGYDRVKTPLVEKQTPEPVPYTHPTLPTS